jgi:hypothetical protein
LHEPTLGIPDFVPGIGGANIGVVIPTVGIIAGFAIAIPIAILLLGWVFKVSIVDRLLKPGGDDIPEPAINEGIKEVCEQAVINQPIKFDITDDSGIFNYERWPANYDDEAQARTNYVSHRGKDIHYTCPSTMGIDPRRNSRHRRQRLEDANRQLLQ